MIGLFLVSYHASQALFSGIVLGFLAKKYCSFLVKNARAVKQLLNSNVNLFWSVLFYSQLLIIILFSFLLAFDSIKPILNRWTSKTVNAPSFGTVESFHITINPVSNELIKFELSGEAKLYVLLQSKEIIGGIDFNLGREQEKMKLLNRQISSHKKGFLFKELNISSLSDNFRILKSKDGRELLVNVTEGAKLDVDLLNFPVGSFYQAQYGENLKIHPYLETETITWSVLDSKRGIRFAYIAPPYHYLRGFFNPLLKLAYVNKWVIVAIGGIVAFIFTSKHKQTINVSSLATAESKSMTETYQSKYDQRNSNNQFIDQAQPGSNPTFNQHNYTPEQKQNLAQSAAEIQQLLNQLAQTNPTTEQVTAAVHQEIKHNPTFKARLLGALEAGVLEALKTAVNHPLFSIPAETIKGWLEAE